MTRVSPVLYQSQADKYPEIRKDYFSIMQCSDKVNKLSNLEKSYYNNEKKIDGTSGLLSVFNVIPTFRRLSSVPDKIRKNDKIPAAGLVTLAILNGPEDLRDMKSSYRQIKAAIEGSPFKPAYNNRTLQHPFSFFRGTLMHNFANPDVSPFPKLAKWLFDRDKTLFDSPLGKLTERVFNIKTELVQTGIKNITKDPPYIMAYEFSTASAFGDITARALARTTKLGALFLGALETAHFVKEINKRKSIKKEAAKSTVSYLSSMAGIGYAGAIGAKHFGPAGSLAGMGLGAVLGSKVSNYISNNLIDKD